MPSFVTIRRQGGFVEEKRCSCPVNQLHATKFTKVVCKGRDTFRKLWWGCIIAGVVVSALIVVPMVTYFYILQGQDADADAYGLKYANTLEPPAHPDRSNSFLPFFVVMFIIFGVVWLVFLIVLVVICITAYERVGPQNALQILYNCRSCGHEVNRTYECIVHWWGGGYHDGLGHHPMRTCRTYSTWGRYTNTEKTLVLNKQMTMTNFEDIDRKFDVMTNIPADNYKTSKQWTDDIIMRLD